MEPLPYLEFLALQQHASIVITDSGGIQEETTFLGVPCLTVRENTERPITTRAGNKSAGWAGFNEAQDELQARHSGKYKERSTECGSVPDSLMGWARSRAHRTDYCAMARPSHNCRGEVLITACALA